VAGGQETVVTRRATQLGFPFKPSHWLYFSVPSPTAGGIAVTGLPPTVVVRPIAGGSEKGRISRSIVRPMPVRRSDRCRQIS